MIYEPLSQFAQYKAEHRWPAYSSLKELVKFHIYSKDLWNVLNDLETKKLELYKLIEPP